MSKGTPDLCAIMRAGGSVKINARTFSTADLCTIARAGIKSGAKLSVIGAEILSTSDLCSIARAHPGHVFFE